MRKAFKAFSKKENINVKPPIVVCQCGLSWFEEFLLTLGGREAELRFLLGFIVLLVCFEFCDIFFFINTCMNCDYMWTFIYPFRSITFQAWKYSGVLLWPVSFLDTWWEFSLWRSLLSISERFQWWVRMIMSTRHGRNQPGTLWMDCKAV